MKILALFLLLAPDTAFCQDDIVTKAMRDEIARSMKKLQLENLEKPYFISYSVYDTDSASAVASFGSLNGKAEEQRSRFARIQVRVGDYRLDNRNFFSASFGGSGVSRGFGGFTTLPLDDNYDEIRRQLWLATDAGYKKALEDISKKRALLANRNRSEVIPDFSKEPAVTVSDVLPRADINIPEIEKLVRDLSAVFKQSPDISTSSVSLRISNQLVRYVNSEGAFSTIRQPEIQLAISTSSQAADGQPLAAGFAYRTRSMSDLPSLAEIIEKIRLRSKQIAELRAAPLPDRYAGPVLFEGEAAPEIVYRTFMPHILATPEILVDNPQYRSMVAQDSENLVEKIGLRVLPEFLSLVDDPEASSFGSLRLLGAYKVDDEGVRSRRVPSASYTPRAANPFEPGGTSFVSLVIPALLFEDATVQRPTGSVNKPPFLEHPYFSKK